MALTAQIAWQIVVTAELDADARERCLLALAGGGSVSEAARRSGYSRVHVHRLMKDAKFLADLERRREKLGASEHETADEVLALGTLREIAGDKDAKPSDRVAASKALLAHIAASRKPVKAGPQAAPEAPIVKLVEGGATGEAAAAEWLKNQA